MNKNLIFILFLFFMVPLVSAKINIEPDSFQVNLAGGESTTKTITLVWEGETSVVAYLNYEIEQING
ncbi:MAG: hypothetical protein J7K83_01415, partial [Candidatus Aenigmarchaeota archaeon]|nr:hypothetical protein [Candidatus Aenigmarchaeota archaeon]